jgi:hypothetical protein
MPRPPQNQVVTVADARPTKHAALTVLFMVAACSSGNSQGGSAAQDGTTDGSGTADPTGGTPGSSADSSADSSTDSATDGPDEEPASCPYAYPLPEVTGCDGVLMTAPEWIAVQTPGVTDTTGPLGLPALRFGGEGASIDLEKSGCLELGKDGTDFSVSFWFKADRLQTEGSFQILSAGISQYGGDLGFILAVEPREERLRARFFARSLAPGYATDLESVEFDYDAWTRITLTHAVHGVGAEVTLTVNDVTRKASSKVEIYNETLRVGDEGWGPSGSFEMADLRSYGRVLAPREIRAQTLADAEVLGISAEALAGGLASVRGHVSGQMPLGTAELEAAVATVTKNAAFIPTDESLITDALDLADLYETMAGPLFDNEGSMNGIADVPVAGEPDAVRDARAMADVFQVIHDEVFRGESVAACRDVLEGRRWDTADHYPGAVTATVDPSASLRVPVDATARPIWGRPVAFAPEAKVRPTGLYLPPGSIGRVTVPPEMVGKGMRVQVGAHTQDYGHHAHRWRFDRVSRRFEIDREVTYVASPLGGGIYFEVPYGSDAGLVDVEIENAVEAPFYSMRSFDKTTPEQWQQRRTAGVPWAVFVSDHFMMVVPSNWVSAKDDPGTSFLHDWDISMQAFSESQGIPPENRNDVVGYLGVDVNIMWGVYGVGYPQVNYTYDPRGDEGGDSQHPMVTNPLETWAEFHELGHAQLHSMFRGEIETTNEMPAAYVMNTRFGYDVDQAFAWSSTGTDIGFTPDQAAQDWMVTENFRNGAEMNYSNTTKDEFRYQYRGRAKYIDIVRLFGWEAFTDFNHQEHLDYMAETPSDGLDGTDSRILRLSVEAGEDLTPLIHFWGIHPVDPVALRAQMDAKGLTVSTTMRDHLLRYHDFIPNNNAELLELFEELHPGMPEGESPDYGPGWYHVLAQSYDETYGQRAHDALDDIVALYFP